MPTPGYPSGWDDNAVIEKAGVAILTRWLSQDPKHRFYSEIKDGDKSPNYDGEIQFGHRMAGRGAVVPIGTIAVQVKSTVELHNLADGLGKTYSCDVAVFRSVISSVKRDLTALVVVEVGTEVIYWLDLTPEFLAGLSLGPLQKKCTIHLKSGDALDDYDSFFESLVARQRGNQRLFDALRTRHVIVPFGHKRDESLLLDVQDAYCYLNQRLWSDLRFLRSWGFPESFEVALEYAEKDGRYYLGVVPVCRQDSESYAIRRLDLSKETGPSGFPLVGRFGQTQVACGFRKGLPLHDAIDQVLERWASSYCDTQIVPVSIMSDTMLAEAAFCLADCIAA